MTHAIVASNPTFPLPPSSREREAKIARRPLSAAERAWSQGQPLLQYPDLPPRAEDKDPAEMTLAELISTQRMDIRSTSRQAFDETGAGVLSLDMPIRSDDGDDEGTLADLMPADVLALGGSKARFQTLIPVDAMTAEEQVAYERFRAHHPPTPGPTVYTAPDARNLALVRRERENVRHGNTVTYRPVQRPDGTTGVNVLGTGKLSHEAYMEHLRFYKRLMLGFRFTPLACHIPAHRATPAERAEARTALRRENALRREMQVGIAGPVYREAYLPDERHHADAEDDPFAINTEELATNADDEPMVDDAGNPVTTWLLARPRTGSRDDEWHGSFWTPTPIGDADSDPYTIAQILGDAVTRTFGYRNSPAEERRFDTRFAALIRFGNRLAGRL